MHQKILTELFVAIIIISEIMCTGQVGGIIDIFCVARFPPIFQELIIRASELEKRLKKIESKDDYMTKTEVPRDQSTNGNQGRMSYVDAKIFR